ncbi:hypothetical protein [Saccharothrix deserti]|uniref:hypothetical protein n=1 Tax=Saccharothrix deserti TaxID=2593674 RepID=UPI00131C01F5|nr:hypothetical protein [Saccharothrix deserti]
MAAEAELGSVTATYRTDNRRRGWTSAILLLVGAVVTVPGVAFWAMVADRSGKVRTAGDPLLLPSLVVGLGLGSLLMGVGIGVWFLTHRGEVFQLHENGLRYSRANRSQSFTWADVDHVVVRPGKDTALARWAGGDINCAIRLIGGGKVTITGLTHDARQLVQHIQTATAR